ncbi:metal dependent phosphohydrolase [Lysobacter enzymogenes]|uniref:Metal dependent phosphohydrolase n=1 Tax=Lysobacter enzymogenes TaxID=69 RepID=A0A0S2DNK2_LYSEN|nr:HD domain-containing protein [Lysobacter enzymogenes]ALN59720.1 metal dependent phosphohydrolase [Lysobacter enzymogenes]
MTHDHGSVLRAAAFAAQRHRRQRRHDAERSPYINHPLALADTLANLGGIADPVVLCAALLHDTVEDTATTLEEIELAFGARVAAVVAQVSDDKSLPKDERKRLQIEHARHISPEARLVKLADKICNLRDLLQSPPPWTRQRKREYFDWAAQVVAGLRGVHPVLEEEFDAVYARIDELGDSV